MSMLPKLSYGFRMQHSVLMFALELGGTWNDDLDGTEGHNNDRTAMIRMRYNLFNGNADTYREKQAYYQLMEATGIEERAQRQVAEGLSLAWNAYQLLDKQMRIFELITSKKAIKLWWRMNSSLS